MIEWLKLITEWDDNSLGEKLTWIALVAFNVPCWLAWLYAIWRGL